MSAKLKLLRSVLREMIEHEDSEDGKRKIFVLVGPPSVGKSTWISRTFGDMKPYIISRDDVADDVAASHGWTYDDMFEPPPADAKIGDTDEKYGKVVKSPSWMTRRPLSYSGVLDANNEVQSKFSDMVTRAVDSGLDIVVDMTNMSARARQGALAAIKGHEDEFKKVAVVFPFQGAEDAVKAVAAKRAAATKAAGGSKTVPPDVIDDMMKAFERVAPEEGFDEVVEFDNRAKLRALAGM